MREAILHLDDADLAKLGFRDVLAALRDAGLQDVTELSCHGPGGVILFQVDEPIPPGDLDAFDAVEWWEQLAVGATGVTYLSKVMPPTDVEVSIQEHGLSHDVTAVDETGIDISIVGSQEAIGKSVAAIHDAGMDALLRRLTDYQGPASSLDGLTERQREVIETAYAMGYYEVPRDASAAEVAAEVGVDTSTVTEHLQRAERNLLSRLLRAEA